MGDNAQEGHTRDAQGGRTGGGAWRGTHGGTHRGDAQVCHQSTSSSLTSLVPRPHLKNKVGARGGGGEGCRAQGWGTQLLCVQILSSQTALRIPESPQPHGSLRFHRNGGSYKETRRLVTGPWGQAGPAGPSGDTRGAAPARPPWPPLSLRDACRTKTRFHTNGAVLWAVECWGPFFTFTKTNTKFTFSVLLGYCLCSFPKIHRPPPRTPPARTRLALAVGAGGQLRYPANEFPEFHPARDLFCYKRPIKPGMAPLQEAHVCTYLSSLLVQDGGGAHGADAMWL